jgi:hypothetical protein
MNSMVTDEEIQKVVDAGTDFVLMFPAADGNAVNGELVRHHVAATLSYLAAAKPWFFTQTPEE